MPDIKLVLFIICSYLNRVIVFRQTLTAGEGHVVDFIPLWESRLPLLVYKEHNYRCTQLRIVSSQ
jgi:hypothetical protein